MPLTDEDFLIMATVVGSRSTCNRRRVGALLVRDRRIISLGYNGNPSKMPHCDHHYEEEVCTTAVHAEANTIAFAAKHGISTWGAILYSTDVPCLDCAKLIINAGIGRVIYFREYRNDHGKDLLKILNIEVKKVTEPKLYPLLLERGDREGVRDWEPSQSVDPDRGRRGDQFFPSSSSGGGTRS
jgi:dCMP deaminase